MEYQRFPCHDRKAQEKIDLLPKLKPSAKKRWVDALLSGRYKQAKGKLRRGNEFCCLGVACDVFKEDVGIEWVPALGAMSFDTSGTHLGESIARVLGLPDHRASNIEVIYRGEKRWVSDLNDDGVGFEMIAGLIINQL